MSDRSFVSAVQCLEDAKRRSPDEATRLIFDGYRMSSREQKDAIVLALIGEMVTAEARRRSTTTEATQSPSAVDCPTAEELHRGDIAAVVKNGQLTPQEAEVEVRRGSKPYRLQIDLHAIEFAAQQLSSLRGVISQLTGLAR